MKEITDKISANLGQFWKSIRLKEYKVQANFDNQKEK